MNLHSSIKFNMNYTKTELQFLEYKRLWLHHLHKQQLLICTCLDVLAFLQETTITTNIRCVKNNNKIKQKKKNTDKKQRCVWIHYFFKAE